MSYFPNAWKEAKIITLPKSGKDPKFPQNLWPISLLSSTGKLFEKVIQKIVQRQLDTKNLLNASQFGFRARHSTTLQCMRLTDHITLTFNNNMSTAAVFLDIEKAFDTTWHSGLLYKVSKLQFPENVTKLINSYLKNRKLQSLSKANYPRQEKYKQGCHKVPYWHQHYTAYTLMTHPEHQGST
jgi:hypothetical protein